MPSPPQPPVRPQLARVEPRNFFRVVSHAAGSGREHHTVTAPRRGPNRERARDAIVKLLRRAEAMHHRVTFTVTTADGLQLSLGSKGGYDPARALQGCQIERDDPYAWLRGQLHGRIGPELIIGVDLDTWPAP